MKGMAEMSGYTCMVMSYHCHIIIFNLPSHYVIHVALQKPKEVPEHCEGREEVG